MLHQGAGLTGRRVDLSEFPFCDIVLNGIEKKRTAIKDLGPPAWTTGKGVLSCSTF
jgi:hypothetical protein